MEETTPLLYPNLESLGRASAFVDEIIDIIDFVPLFQGFDRDEIELLAGFMPCYGAPSGETLLREGEPGDFMLLLLTGQVEVRKRDATGKDRRITIVTAGTTLGEMSLVDGEARFASCITSLPVDFAVLRRADLNRLLEQAPRLCCKLSLMLLQLMTRRLRETSMRMLHLPVEAMV